MLSFPGFSGTVSREGIYRMHEEQKPETTNQVERRSLVTKGLKAAYIIPAVLAAIKATERPAYAQSSGSPTR